MRICSWLGIRPDVVRLSLHIKEMDKGKNTHLLGATGQHYSDNLWGIFFKELGVRQPDFNLEIGSGTYNEQQARILLGMEKVAKEAKPNINVILGDNTSALGLALASNNLGIPFVHIESGGRCFDARLPEERYRPIIDRLAALNLSYHETYRENLLMEGYEANRIIVVGNPIVDVVRANIPKAMQRKLNPNVSRKEYVFATIHRHENVTSKVALIGIMNALGKLTKPVILPMFPKTKQQLDLFGITLGKNITVVEPMGYLDTLKHLKEAYMVVTDSGTVPEECCELKVPCVQARMSTERQELLACGSMALGGTSESSLFRAYSRMEAHKDWESPYKSGATQNIVDAINNNLPLIRETRGGFIDARKKRSFAK